VIRPGWDFDYAPVHAPREDDEPAPPDVVVATSVRVEAAAIAGALASIVPDATAETVLERAPIFWTRVRGSASVRREDILARLRDGAIPVRYVASARRGSAALGPGLDLASAPPARPAEDWRARPAVLHAEPSSPGTWFLRDGDGGVAVDRRRFGGGAGMRLAVIDDDALEASQLDLDAEILIGIAEPPRHQTHGSLMVAWAAGSRTFDGVAPDASPRLYLIPKPDQDVVSLPVAIARAVGDGADVVVCATYVEGAGSPMLDDALEMAVRLGRGGKGTAVVLPTGRETSSPPGSLHASLSLGFADPASDPRVFCVGPGARGGGWFCFRDRRGRFRPFANRGPAVRWLAPGDDIAYPFATPESLFHAESSGASAIAAGVLLLVLAQSPSLRRSELDAVVTSALAPVPPEHPAHLLPLADPADVRPPARDPDGHNARHGYGRLDARRACLAARDPVASALAAIGEVDLALAWVDTRASDAAVRRAYSPRFGRWMVRALLADPGASHAARALARHLRLLDAQPARARAHPPGAIARGLALLLRGVAGGPGPRPSPRTRAELAALRLALAAPAGGPAAFDAALRERLEPIFAQARAAAALREAPQGEDGARRKEGASSIPGVDPGEQVRASGEETL
jgi:hypothetical protein